MQNRYQHLLKANLPTEQFARQALGLLEAELREMALLSLQEWLKLDIVSPDLFNAVANLRFPSWGSWNGLLIILRKVRHQALRQSDKAMREQIEQSALSDLLNRLSQNIKNDRTKPWLPDFYKQFKQSQPTKPTLQHLLSTPIGLRNRIAHDNPTDPQFWQSLSHALRPVIEWLAIEDLFDDHHQLIHSAPWFIEHQQQRFTYNGFSTKGNALNYVSDSGTLLESSEHVHRVLQTLKKIMGKTDLQEQDFRKLLSKLAPEESKGVVMGDYLVGKFIGEGSHGVVHQGIQINTGRQVAIKFLKEEMSDDVKLRFRQEAEFLSRLNHPHIVNVIEYAENEAWHAPKAYSLKDETWYQDFSKGATGGIKTFIAMEWITGQTLDDYYQQQKHDKAPVDFPQLTQWFSDASTALEHVHQSDIIHRDIKPSNLMINEQDIIKLMDFGIARSYESDDARLTTDLNARLGSPAYMSPEQIKASQAESQVSPASDVYGLCAVFYELYTQKRLYNHDDESVTVETITEIKTKGEENPVAPTLCNKKIPWELDTILSGGLEYETADRYQDMKSLKRDLVHYQKNEPIEYQQPTVIRRTQLWYRRGRKVINTVMLSLLILAGMTGVYLYDVTLEKERAELAEGETKEQLLEAHYHQAKSYEQKALLSLSKGNKEQKDDGNKSLLEYRKAWLYALEANKIKLPKDKAALKKDTLVKLTNISSRAIYLTKKSPSGVVNLGSVANAITYSPNGVRLASMSNDHIQLWDTKTGKLIQIIKAVNNNKFEAITYSSDGAVLASVSHTKNISLWDSKSGKLIKKLKSHAFLSGVLGYNPINNIQLASVSYNTIQLWNTQPGKLIHTLEGHTDNVTDVAYSPDGSILASASRDKTIRLWDVQSGRLINILRGHTKDVVSLSYSPENSVLASSSRDETIRLWNTKSGKLIKTFKGYSSGTKKLVFNLKGDKLAYVSLRGEIKILDAISGKLIQKIKVNNAIIIALAYKPNGVVLTASLYDKSIRHWNTKLGELINENKGHTDDVKALIYSPDGSALASASKDRTICLWSSSSGQLIRILNGHTGSVTALAYSPDGLVLASSSKDDTVRLWNTKSGNLIRVLNTHFIRSVEALAYNSDGSKLIIATLNGSIAFWDTKLGKFMSHYTRSELSLSTRVILANNKHKLLFASDNMLDKSIQLSDANSGEFRQLLKAHSNEEIEKLSYSPKNPQLSLPSSLEEVKKLSFKPHNKPLLLPAALNDIQALAHSPNDSKLVSTYLGGNIQLWDTNSGKLLKIIRGHTETINALVYSPDGMVFTSASDDKSIRVWDAKSGKLKQLLKGYSRGINALAYSPDSSILASISHQDGLRFWDAKPGKLMNWLKGDIFLNTTAFSYSPNGSTIAFPINNRIRFWDAESGRLIQQTFDEKSIFSRITSLVYSPDGTVLASGNSEGAIQFIDSKSGKLIQTLEGHVNEKTAFSDVNILAYSPNASLLASGSWGEIKLWDSKSGKLIQTFEGNSNNEDTIDTLAFNPNSSILAFAFHNNDIHLWNTTSRKLVRILKGHTNRVTAIEYSSDGLVLASASYDKTIRLWNTKSGKLIHTLKGHTSKIVALSYSPDGSVLASTSQDNTIRYWNPYSGKLLQTIKGNIDSISTLTYIPNSKKVIASLSTNGAIRLWDKNKLITPIPSPILI